MSVQMVICITKLLQIVTQVVHYNNYICNTHPIQIRTRRKYIFLLLTPWFDIVSHQLNNYLITSCRSRKSQCLHVSPLTSFPIFFCLESK